MAEASRAERWWRLVPLLAVVLASGLLLSSALFMRGTVERAATMNARGIGGAFAFAGRELWRPRGEIPSQAELDAFLASHHEEGLRYLAIVNPDGSLFLSTGESAHPGALHTDEIAFFDDLARIEHKLPPWAVDPALAKLPPPSPDEPEKPSPRAVYEFVPLVSLELRSQARWLLLAAVGVSALLLLLALAFHRSQRQQESLRDTLERGRHLAALGEMSAVLAHELRNPLAALKGHAQLLVEQLPEEERPHQKAQRVVSEAVRIEQLINDLLAFVRRGALERRPVDPNVPLRAAIESLGAPVVLLDAPSARLWPLDAPRLQQALANIVQNALQADPGGRAPVVSIHEERDGLRYVVRDFGPGIPPGEEARIFAPFYTKRTRGVGLGLAIAQRVVELHRGRLTAANHPDGGAEFTLWLPAEG